MSAFFWRTAAGAFAVRHSILVPDFEWTTFAPSEDTSYACVDPTLGDDGTAYFGTNRTLAEASPFQTLLAAYAELRDGYPDWLLLKRGETWLIGIDGMDMDGLGYYDGQYIFWNKRGRSMSERMLLSCYGSTDLPRPYLKSRATELPALWLPVSDIGETVVKNFAVVGLDFKAFTRDPSDPGWVGASTGTLGLSVGGVDDLLVEDCRFAFYAGNIAIGPTNVAAYCDGVQIRGCVIADSYAVETHTQGLFTHTVTNLVVENVFAIHNGWLRDELRGATVTNVSVVAAGNKFVRESGSWIDDGYKVGSAVRSTDFENDRLLAVPESFTLVTGTETSGSYADVADDDENWHVLDGDGSDNFDGYYEFDTSAMGTPTRIRLVWELTGAEGEKIMVYAWDWGDAAWREITFPIDAPGINGGMRGIEWPFESWDGNYDHTDFIGTGGDAGKVRIRLASTSMSGTLTVDELWLYNRSNVGDPFYVLGVTDLELTVDPGAINVFVDEGPGGTVSGRGEASKFDRNFYISDTENPVFRDCVDSDGSSGGMQLRVGGLVERCLFIRAPLAIALSNDHNPDDTITGTARYNVILGGRNIDEDEPFASGIGWNSLCIGTTRIYENIIAHNVDGTGNVAGIYHQGIEGYQSGAGFVHDNIVYDWTFDGSGRAFKLGLDSGSDLGISDIQVYDNVFDPKGGQVIGLQSATGKDGLTLATNQYWTEGLPSSDWFQIAASLYDYAGWQGQVTDTGATLSASSYSDPDRDIESYMTSLSLAPATIENFNDLCREQSKDNWNEDLSARSVINYVRAGFDRSAV